MITAFEFIQTPMKLRPKPINCYGNIKITILKNWKTKKNLFIVIQDNFFLIFFFRYNNKNYIFNLTFIF